MYIYNRGMDYFEKLQAEIDYMKVPLPDSSHGLKSVSMATQL